MSNQIDLIVSRQAQQQIDDLYKSLEKTHNEIIAISKVQLSFNAGGSPKSITDLNNAIKESIKQTENLTEAERKLLVDSAKLERLRQAQIQSQIRANNLARSNANEANRQAIANERLSSAYLQLSRQQAESARRVQDLIARGRTGSQTQREYNRELQNAQNEFNRLNQRVLQADTAVGRFNRNVGNYPRQAFSAFTNLLGAFGVVGGLSLFADITKDIYSTTKELQSLDLALKQVVETDAKFAESQAFLSDVSEKYGIEINGLTKQFTQFYVSAKDKISGKEIQQIFESVAKSAGFMGLSVDAQNRAFTALNQMMSKGTVSAEELKGQLGEALPGAFGIMAKALNVNEKQLGKMMQQGQVLASDVLPKFAKELEKAYGIENKDRVESLTASQTRLSNAWTDFIRQLNYGDSVISKVVSSGLSLLSDKFKEVTERMKSFTQKNKELNEELRITASKKGAEFAEKVIEQENGRQRIESLILKLQKDAQEKRAEFDRLTRLSTDVFNSGNKSERNLEFIRKNKETQQDLNRILSIQYGRIAGLQQVLNDYNKKLSTNTAATKENTKAKRENLEAVNELEARERNYSGRLSFIPELEKQISLFKDAQKEVSVTSEQYKQYQTVIDGLQQSIDLITDPSKVIKAPLIDNSSVADTKKILEDLKKVTDDYLKGFIDSFGSQAGFPTLFKAMQKEIVGFGSDFNVTMVTMMEIGQEAFNFLNQQSQNYFNAEYSRLEQQKETALKFAGTSATAKEEIERQYNEKRKKIQREQAQKEKESAMFNIAVNTAQAVVATLGKSGFAGLPLALIVGAIGAAQLAFVASQEIPAFKDGGVHKGGMMLINDAKGSNYEEVVQTPDGKNKRYKGRNVLVNAPKGTKIFTPEQWNTQINQSQKIESSSSTIIEKNTEIELLIDENGFKKMITSQGAKREILNSRLRIKGQNV